MKTAQQLRKEAEDKAKAESVARQKDYERSRQELKDWIDKNSAVEAKKVVERLIVEIEKAAKEGSTKTSTKVEFDHNEKESAVVRHVCQHFASAGYAVYGNRHHGVSYCADEDYTGTPYDYIEVTVDWSRELDKSTKEAYARGEFRVW